MERPAADQRQIQEEGASKLGNDPTVNQTRMTLTVVGLWIGGGRTGRQWRSDSGV